MKKFQLKIYRKLISLIKKKNNKKKQKTSADLNDLVNKKSKNKRIGDYDFKNKKIKKLMKNIKSTSMMLNDEQIKSMAKAVLVNKFLIKKDDEHKKRWQELNHYGLFEKFIELIDEYYDNLGKNVKKLRDESVILQEKIKKYNQIIEKHKKTIEYIQK